MGVFCEINLFKSRDGVFVAGSTVKGAIRYAVDEETTFGEIVVSLKGKGVLCLKRKHNDKSKEVTYRRSEQYLDLNNVVVESGKNIVITKGSYEIPFTFRLPRNIPPTFRHSSSNIQYAVNCNIRYYLSIKFQRPGFWKLDKKYKKEITIDSGIQPRLPLESIIYGKQKKLSRLFTRKNSAITIKAGIAKSVIAPGDKVEFEYEVVNDSNVIVKAVETKLLEVLTFKTKSKTVTECRDVPQTECKTGSVKSDDSQTMSVEIDVPLDNKSLDFSELVARDYYVQITVELPFPHFDSKLQIPIQVGDTAVSNLLEPPPSYWEAMGEEEKDDKDN
ncbi:arrestin domain-containing protein 17-like [Battus philenor]|uniref:arrestin domain-containing protein 17-like n=1 Tax=Battus philenor TaxID=42288 RepID=UPI0035D09D8A